MNCSTYQPRVSLSSERQNIKKNRKLEKMGSAYLSSLLPNHIFKYLNLPELYRPNAIANMKLTRKMGVALGRSLEVLRIPWTKRFRQQDDLHSANGTPMIIGRKCDDGVALGREH